ncbi:MAG: hypothetical protein R3E01_29740 [Pirellulaceae bacterium]|nr:hypothetical protein [Planctomycetales bacterium]
MKCTHQFVALLLLSLATICCASRVGSAREVVAFWGFADDYNFDTNPNYQDFAADVDGTVLSDANLQAFLGVADALDDNGGNGFVPYTSPTSAIFYDVTKTLKFDDLKGGGDDFAIAGSSTFDVDKNDGNGPQPDNFSNDALMYITLDGTGYQDFEIRFDVEGTPASLPTSFDIFYRTGGAGTWSREPAQNNIGLSFVDYTPADPENQYADSGVISLSSLLNNASKVEIIINDFAEAGNGEMEIDNVEITAAVVPEPASWVALVIGVVLLLLRSRS